MKSVIALRYSNHTIILMDDFNHNLLNINTNNQVLEYYLSMLSAGLYPFVLRPTRVTSRSATLSDHIWSSNNELMKKSGIILNDISDHFPTFAFFDLTVQKPDNIDKCTRRMSNDGCVIKFQNKLMSSSWSSLYTFNTVDKAYDRFYEMLFRIYDECFHIVTHFKRKKTLLSLISQLNLNVWSIRKKNTRV